MAKFDMDTMLGCLLRILDTDKRIFEQFHQYIEPNSFFENDDNLDAKAFRKILSIMNEWRLEGRWKDLKSESLDSAVQMLPDSEVRDASRSLIRRMLTDPKIIQKSNDPGCLLIFLDYLKVIALKKGAVEFSNSYRQGHIADAIRQMKELTTELDGIGIKDHAIMDAEGLMEKFSRLAQTAGINNFKSGIDELDGIHGWYEPQTLNVFAAPTGAGKSMMATTLVLQAIRQGKYVSLTCVEDKDTTVEYRVLAALTGIKIGTLKNSFNTLNSIELAKFNEAQKLLKKYVDISYIYGESIDYIHQWVLNRDIARGVKADIDIVDYTMHIAKLSPGSQPDHQYSYAYSQRKDFALKHNKVCFDFIQVNREGNKKNASASGVLGESDFAGAYAMALVCDTIITINRSNVDAQQECASLFIAKGREGGKGLKYSVQTDFAHGMFVMSSARNEFSHG